MTASVTHLPAPAAARAALAPVALSPYTSAVGSYVALLRGINVGGKNVIPMSKLAATFEGLGLDAVKTVIASGNVLFSSPRRDARRLERELEEALTHAHAYDATVVLRSKAEMAATVASLPGAWLRPRSDTRYYVLFLRHEVDSPDLVDELAPRRGVDAVGYAPGALFWSAPFAALTRSAMARFTAHRIYKHVTIRNLNTTKKIAALLEGYP